MRTEITGKPIPNSPYAISCHLDTAGATKGYEVGDPEIVNAMKAGYPRFRFDDFYSALKDQFNHACDGNFVMPFPSENVAKQCVKFVGHGKVIITPDGIALASMPLGHEAVAKSFWQHTGQIITARQAENLILGRQPKNSQAANIEIKGRIANLTGEQSSDVYLYSTGMAAVFSSYLIATDEGKNGKTIQLGFPYVDTLKIQQKFGEGSLYIPYNSRDDLENVEDALRKGDVSAIFCEIPGNPLLHTINLPRLRKLCDRYEVPLLIDDTIGSFVNVDLKPYADIIVTSLTKSFSGAGDVMGGSLVLNSNSKFYDKFKASLDSIYEDLLYPDDSIVLAKHSEGFEDRMKIFNANGEIIADYLNGHPAVEKVFHPSFIDNPEYREIQKPGGGTGSLMSFVLKDRNQTEKCFDAFDFDKGPSLHLESNLACLYTWLAHFNEREFAEANGIDWHLIRLSVGTESPLNTIRSLNLGLS